MNPVCLDVVVNTEGPSRAQLLSPRARTKSTLHKNVADYDVAGARTPFSREMRMFSGLMSR